MSRVTPRRIQFLPVTKKDFAELEKVPSILGRIHARIERLANIPIPSKSLQMQGMNQSRRVRVGNYRIIYSLPDDNTVLIECVGHRKDVFKKHQRRMQR